MLDMSWITPFTTKQTDEIFWDLAQVHATRITHAPTREYFLAGIARRDYRVLCDFDTSSMESANDLIQVRQCQAFFSKRDDIDLGCDRRGTAIKKFIEAESLCRETNLIFSKRARGEFSFSPLVERVLFRAQQKIAQILGPVPTVSQLRLRFGNGATTNVQKKHSCALTKCSAPFQCSEEMGDILKEVLSELPHLVGSRAGDVESDNETWVVPVELVPGRLDFVRKNAKTDRAIVVEPGLNVIVQAGLGDFLADRLERYGLTIRDQSLNQRCAQWGSISGDLATLDLSSASDTIATAIVWELLPVDWAALLACARSGKMEYEGKTYLLEKFSSMGNGFTFPLETIIFYAIAFACAEDTDCPTDPMSVRAYGDDIIAPTGAVEALFECLRSLGFIVNRDKSFWTGRFRESCGADYLGGINVRPCYQKTRASPASLFVLHNFYVRGKDGELANLVLSHIPIDFHLFGPDGFGDGVLVDRWWSRRDLYRSDEHRDRGFGGGTFEMFRLRPRKTWFKLLPGDYVFPLYATYLKGRGALTDDDRRPSVTSRLGYMDKWELRSFIETVDSASPLSPRAQVRKNCGGIWISLPDADGFDLIRIYTLG